MKYIFIDGKRVATLKEIICPVCKEKFKPKTSKNKYCSKTCYYKMKRIRGDRVNWTDEMRDRLSKRYMGDGNPMYGKEGVWKGKKRPDMWGDKHASWKGGYWIDENGYKVIQNEKETGGEKIFEHRMVWERNFGTISDGMLVHHKNKNKLDNRIENLELMTRAEHINHHRADLQKQKSL